MIGSTLGNYKILEKVGEGGQGTVYRAIDSKLGRPVVIKVLPAELTAKEANLKRFEREARLASALDHPNICTIFGLHKVDDIHFMAMQYVEGRNVREGLGRQALHLRDRCSRQLRRTSGLNGNGLSGPDSTDGRVPLSSDRLAESFPFPA